jgi:ATP-binding cassette subfamily C (CFTR/MRP) protein 1
MNAEIEYFDKTPVGEVLQILTCDLNACDGVTVQVASGAFVYGVGYGLCVVIVTVVKIPWLILSVVPCIFAVGILIDAFRTSSEKAENLANGHTSVFNLFVELMSGLTTIRACYADPLLYRHFSRTLDKDTLAIRDAKNNEQWLFLWAECVAGVLLSSIIFAVAGLRGPNGVQVSDASFVLLNGCFGSFIIFIIITRQIEISNLAAHRKRVIAAIPVTNTNLEVDPSISQTTIFRNMTAKNQGGTIEMTALVPHITAKSQGCTIEMKGVHLSYGKDLDFPSVITNMNLEIPANQRVGLVGRTGSGKSTIIRALSGLLTPSVGLITLNGKSIDSISRPELREMVCVIPQTPHLFAGTIRFNLDPIQRYSDAQLWDSLKQAGADEFVSRDTKGLDTNISSGAADLSSGERQLLCLARALLHRARLILLDEATASLDDALLVSIEAALARCSQSATIIQIAHQTVAVVKCDRLLVLQSGKVIEDGAPLELMKKPNGEFFTMVHHDARRREI